MKRAFLPLLLCLVSLAAGQEYFLYGLLHEASSTELISGVLQNPAIAGTFVQTDPDGDLSSLISIVEETMIALEKERGKEKFVFTDFTGFKAEIIREAFQTSESAGNGSVQGSVHIDTRLNGDDKVASHVLLIDKLLSLVDSINTPPKTISVIIDETLLGQVALSRILQKSREAKRKISSFHVLTDKNILTENFMLNSSEFRVIIVDTSSEKAAAFLTESKNIGVAGFNGMFQWFFTERSQRSLTLTCSRPGGHYFGVKDKKVAVSEKYIIDTVMHCKNDAGMHSGAGCIQSYKSLSNITAYGISPEGDSWLPVQEFKKSVFHNYDIPAEHHPLWPRLRVAVGSSYEPWLHIIDFNQTKIGDKLCGMDGRYAFRYRNKSSTEQIPICVYGLSIDLLKSLEEKLEFVGEIRASRDGLYGTYREDEGTVTGVLKDIYEGHGDIGLDLMDDSKRNKVVDFTTPTATASGAIGYIQSSRYNSSVFGPFGLGLWMSILACIVAVMIFVGFLERVSPYGQYEVQQRTISEDDPFDAAESMNYVWGIFLSGEIIRGKPKSFGSRASLIVFAFVSILILAAYSANLIAFLVVLDEKPLITGIDDPKLLNEDSKIIGGHIEGSSLSDSLQFSYDARLRKLYKRMKAFSRFSDALQALKSGEITVLIGDAYTLKHTASLDHDCAIRVMPVKNTERGVGVVFKKDSKWKSRFNLAVTQLRSSGAIDKMFRLWFSKKQCTREVSFFQLSIKEVGILFIILACGVLGCLLIALVLYIWTLFLKYRERKYERRISREH